MKISARILPRSNRAILLLMAILGLLIYFNSLNNSFHFDDEHHILSNPHIRSLRNIPFFFIDPTMLSGYGTEIKEGSHYRPLLMVTHTVNYLVGGLSPFGYHLVNLAFHVGSAFLVFLIVKAMVDMTFFAPLAAGLIFLVHPFNSEVVNYITARSSVMCAFFYLLAFYFWIRFRKAAGVTYYLLPTTYFYIASLLSFILALLTKEIAITLPAILFLYDFYFIRKPHPHPVPPLEGEGSLLSLRERIKVRVGILKKSFITYLPFLIPGISYILLRRFFTGTVYDRTIGGYENTLTQIRILAGYIQLLLWPSSLSIEHDINKITSIFQIEFLWAMLILIVIIFAGIWPGLSKKVDMGWRVSSFFILWYLIVLLPMMPLILQSPLQENRGYLAGVGFAVIAGIGIGSLCQKTPPPLPSPVKGEGKREGGGWGWEEGKDGAGLSRKQGIIWLCLLIPLIIVYSSATIQRNKAWRDDIALWSDALKKNPGSVRAYSNLGRAYLRTGRLDLAERYLLHGLDMSTTFRWIDYIHIRYDLGVLYLAQKKFDHALEHMLEAIHYAPEEPELYVTLGNIYGAEKRWDEAESAYKKALELKPSYTEALARIGIIYVIQERYRDAIPYLMEAAKDKGYPKSGDIERALKKSLDMVTGDMRLPHERVGSGTIFAKP